MTHRRKCKSSSAFGAGYIDWDSRIASSSQRNMKLHPSQREYFPTLDPEYVSERGHSNTATSISPGEEPQATGHSPRPVGPHKKHTPNSDGLPPELRGLYQEYVRTYTSSRDPYFDPKFTLDPHVSALERGWDDRAGPSAAHLSTLLHTYPHYLKNADCPSTLAGPRSLVPNIDPSESGWKHIPSAQPSRPRLVGRGKNPNIERCKALVRMYYNEAGGHRPNNGPRQTRQQKHATQPLRIAPPAPPAPSAPPVQPQLQSTATIPTVIPDDQARGQQMIVESSATTEATQAGSAPSGEKSNDPSNEPKPELMLELVLSPDVLRQHSTASRGQRSRTMQDKRGTYDQSGRSGYETKSTAHQVAYSDSSLSETPSESSPLSSTAMTNTFGGKITLVPKLPKLPKLLQRDHSSSAYKSHGETTTAAAAAKQILDRLEESERKSHWDSTLFGFTASVPAIRSLKQQQRQLQQQDQPQHHLSRENRVAFDLDTPSQRPHHQGRREHSQTRSARPLSSTAEAIEQEAAAIDREIARIQEERSKIKAALAMTTSRRPV